MLVLADASADTKANAKQATASADLDNRIRAAGRRAAGEPEGLRLGSLSSGGR